jgi:uncharacterized membrane protein
MGLDGLAYGCLLGLVLAVGDFVSKQIGARFGRHNGIICWVILVSVPLGVTGFISVPLLAMGLVCGSLLASLMAAIHRKAAKHFPSSPPDASV